MIERVEAGKAVVLTRADKSVTALRPLPAWKGKRPFGLAGEFVIPDDLNDLWWLYG